TNSPHAITAVYGGDGDYGASTSDITNQIVNKAGSATIVTSLTAPSVFGQSVTFTAAVTNPASDGDDSPVPSGVVAFLDGTTNLGTSSLIDGNATLSYLWGDATPLAVRAHEITAVYSGDGNLIG